MKAITLILTTLLLSAPVTAACPDFLDHSMRKLHSKQEVNLCALQDGRPMLLVNTASHCGYTRQFEGLEALHKKYGEEGLVVVGFASDDFRQEAKDEAQAAQICYVNYGVTFTMLAPTPVRGDAANPVFRALAEQSQAPNWNFNKYLLDGAGKVVRHFGSSTEPDSAALTGAIESLL